MSSLEERREARRRRRQQEEEALEQEKARSLSRDDVKRVIDSRLAARRLERKNRRTESPQVNHSNNAAEEEDDGEKRRRERRESRLRQAQDRGSGEADSSATEERSSRRSRRRGGDEEEEAPSAPEPAAEPEPEEPAAAPADEVDNSAAEREAEEKRRREEEAAEEAERQRQAEEERRRRQEEEKRQAEERRRQKTPRTPRHERQSRSKNRTPRGPLKTPRSARQQTSHLGAPSEQTIPEEAKNTQNSNASKSTASGLQERESDITSYYKEGNDKLETPRTLTEKKEKEKEVKSHPVHKAIVNHDSVSDLYAKIDVKAKIKALEAERNKHLFPFSSKGIVDDEFDNGRYSQEDNNVSTTAKRMADETTAGSSGPDKSAKRLRSLQSSSDTDFDDRLTDIVATNREMLSHDDTMERFTDFELGSCSSYDDMFPPKDQKNSKTVPKIDLMETHEFTPDFHCNEVFQSTDSLLESQSLQATQPDTNTTDGSSDPQPLKSILKVKTQDEQAHRESSINRHKTRSSAKERDLRRSSSRSRTRAPPRTPSETSSDDNDHFIPFTVDTEEVIYNPEKRRASAIEEKAERGTSNKIINKQCLSPKSAPGIESMSENESMFSGDDVSSARNSYSIGTSVENLDSDCAELMSANTTLTVTADDDYRENIMMTPTPFTGHDHTITLNDSTDNFISTAILISPTHEIDKVRDMEQKDSDNSQDSLGSSLESSGFAGVKSDIPFSAKKKKIHARRSGRISQMTSIWSRMPDSKEDVHKEAIQSSSVDPPRKIFVIKSARDEPEQGEMTQDSSTTRHRSIDTRMTELQQQLHHDEAKQHQAIHNIPPISTENKKEHKKSKPSKMTQDDPHRYSEAKKKQLDELFGKLNSKLKSKDHDYQKQQYSDRQAPMFLAPFDSSVDAMQRSQSQPILNTSEDMEYYDPSQSVREYIWDDESPNKTPEPPQSLEYQMDEGEDEGSIKAQCSSGDTTSRLGSSSMSNWSARSNIGSGSNPDDYSDSYGEEGEYLLDDQGEEEQEPAPHEPATKAGKVFIRKESVFSLKSNVSDGSFTNNATGYSVGTVPDGEEVFERQAQTNEWLHEDVSLRQSGLHKYSNSSILSNADSASAISIDSVGNASGINEDNLYYTECPRHDMVLVEELSPGQFVEDSTDVGFSMAVGLQEDGEDSDLKLPLHFLNESSPDDEGEYDDGDDYDDVEEGEFDSDRCMDGSGSDPNNYGYSSDDIEDGGLNSSRIVEYGDEYFQGEEADGGVHCLDGDDVVDSGREYFEGENRGVDLIEPMDAMGEDILQYLSDEMDEEGEVEEWGEEELEEEVEDVGCNQDIAQTVQLNQDGEAIVRASSMEEGIVYYTPNSGGGDLIEPDHTYTSDQTQLELRNQTIHQRNIITELTENDESDEDDQIKDMNFNADSKMNFSGITESARRRELFKEHHGHIDDKDIVHCDNLPHGQELPDNDEFFLSFEYDEDHGHGIREEYSDESEGVHDVEIPPLDIESMHHSSRFEQYEAHNVKHVPQCQTTNQQNKCIEYSSVEVTHLSTEDAHVNLAIEPEKIQSWPPTTIEASQDLQHSDCKIFQDSGEINDNSNICHSVHPINSIADPTSDNTAVSGSVFGVAEDLDSSLSTKSNRSDDSDIPPEVKEMRKKLLCELKGFNPKSLRRTSVDESSDCGGSIDTPLVVPTSTTFPALDAPKLDVIQKESLLAPNEKPQVQNMSPIEQYIKEKEELAKRIEIVENPDVIPQVQISNSSVESNQVLSNSGVEGGLKLNTTYLDSGAEFVKLRRNSSSGGQDGGVMSKERRRSIRSFWFQLDEDEKKQKENEENWKKKRDENQHRSRERNVGNRPDGGSMSNIWAKVQSEQNRRNSHQPFNTPDSINSHNSKIPVSGSMQHLDLASNAKDQSTSERNDFQSLERPRKKPPPAVAPKPRRKTAIGITFDVNSETAPPKTLPTTPASKPPKPVQARTTSVKEIASFHEKQSEVFQEKKVFDKPKKQILFNSPFSTEVLSNKTEGSESRGFKKSTFFQEKQDAVQQSILFDRPKNHLFTRFSSSKIEQKSLESSSPSLPSSSSSSSNCEETVISARSEENRRAKLQKVESVLIKRLAENNGMKEALKIGPPVASKPASISTTIESRAAENRGSVQSRGASYDRQTNSNEGETVCLPKHPHFPPWSEHPDTQNKEVGQYNVETKITNERLQKTDLAIPQIKSSMNLNAIISPFSLNLPLNPPTLEEIDVAVDDSIESSEPHPKETINKQQLWIDYDDKKDAHCNKTQAPRPRFNAKALAPSQNVLPSWAKKIEVKPITHVTHATHVTGEVPPLQLSMCGSGSTTSLDNVSNVGLVGGEMSSRDKEIKSWATDYIRDVISLDHHHQKTGFDVDSLGGKVASDSDSRNTSFSANSSFYGHLPVQTQKHGDKSFLSDGLSEPLSSRSLKSKEPALSIAERISKMQEKLESSKEIAKPLEKQNPTQSQKQFASLLQNRLIDVIAQEADEDKGEKERERKKRRPKRPPANSWAAERLRLFGPGKSVIKEETTWSPEQTSTPSTLSRQPTKLNIDVGFVDSDTKASGRSLEDATNKFEDLSQSLSQTEVITMNKVRKREGRQYRRVTTGGINIMEMRDKFAAGTDSSGGSSTESSFGTPKEKTRPNSPWISSSGAFPPSPLVSSVINKLTSAENTDTEGKSDVDSREPSLSRSRGRVAERVRHFSSRENSLPNSRSSSRSRRDSEVISGTFDLKTVSELVRRVESSEESGTSLSSSLSFQPGELAGRSNIDNKLVSEAVRKLHTDPFSSSNSSPSSSLERRTFNNVSAIKNNLTGNQVATKFQPNNNAIARPFRKVDEEDYSDKVGQGLSQAVSALADFQPTKNSRNKRMDKDRRHTTQINFAELRERYNAMGHAKESRPPQSPAMHAIYASSTRHFDSDSDNAPGHDDSIREMQVARSNTFQKTKIETTKAKVGSLQNTNSNHSLRNEAVHNNNDSNPAPNQFGRPKDLGLPFSSNHQATSTPYSSIATPGSLPVSARHLDVEDDVFSPLSSARVPESLNLPSDAHPPPAFQFSARNYEDDDMSHGELAESESSDTVDFVKKRYEERAAEMNQQLQQQQQQQQQQYLTSQRHSSPPHQAIQPHHHHNHHHNQQDQHQHNTHHHQQQHNFHQQNQVVQSLEAHNLSLASIASSSSPSNILGASAPPPPQPPPPPPPSQRHYTAFPETIIDTKTATGRVRCRILSEIPTDRDESGIGASDQSMGSTSTLSISSAAHDRFPEARPQTPQSSIITSSIPTNDQIQNRTLATTRQIHIPDIHLPDEEFQTDQTIPGQLQSPIHRKFSLGNESVSSIEGATYLKADEGPLSPRRASVHAIEQHIHTRTAAVDTHSSSASLSQDSSRSKHENSNGISHSSSHKHDSKRRKSKSKFMQDVMEKRRNKSEPNELKSSHSRKKHTHSSSDLPLEKHGSNGLFGTSVGGRKKSTGSPNGNELSANTMKGYSKRFDALWAKFDPEVQQKPGSRTSDTLSQSSGMPPDAEEEERAREEAEERERERMEAEEAARVKAEEEQKKKKKGKRKGLGGLSAEKKKLLKKLIMQRAAEELRNEAKQKAAEKEKYINDRVAPLKTDGLGQSELQALVKDLHARVSTLEEDVYDWEIKIRKQDFEINELTLKVNDTKGKFIKPVLRKVNKTESKLKKIQVLKESTDFRGNLKSTGQNKYALEEDEADKNNPHWRDELKPKDREDEEAAAES